MVATQTRKKRKSPTESAAAFPEGTIRKGNDGEAWVTKKSVGGIQRWIPYLSAQINGLRPLTVADLAKSVGKPLMFYE